MKRSALIAVLLPIALAAIALPAWGVLTYKVPPAPPAAQAELGPGFRPVAGEPSAAQIAHWQKLADASCKCTRRGGSGTCWAEYDRETAAYAKGDSATMCMPVSHSRDCFGDDIVGDKCVETDRDHAGHLLCAAEERRAVEVAWNREMARARGESLAEIKGPAGCDG